MSIRSLNLIRNVIQKRSLISTIQHVPSLAKKPVNITYHHRFYTSFTSPGKQQHHISTKIPNIVSSPNIIKAANKVEPKTSKLKELTKKYGAAGVLVYLGVGCIDLSVTLGAIYLVGLDKVKVIEENVLDVIYSTGEKFGMKKAPKEESRADMVMTNQSDSTPSFASVFILAYSIHKTLLLPVRLGITAAITPAIVRKLHQLGWTRYFPRLFAITNTTSKKP